MNEQRWRRTTDNARRAVCVDRRRRRRRARRTGRVDWRRRSDDRLNDTGDAKADDGRRRRSDLWVVPFDDVFVGSVEVFRGRLLDEHLLGKLLRKRLRMREQLEQGFRWRTLDFQKERRLRIWRCREGAQAMSA